MKPTDEQLHALELFAAGGSFAIEAGAGAAKTTTLVMAARETPRVGRYLAFNRALANEAREMMPLNVDASTIHSVAFRSYGHQFGHRLDAPRMKPWDVARKIGVEKLVVQLPDKVKVLQPSYLSSLVMRGINTFCQSADEEPSPLHIPIVDAIDPYDSNGNRTLKNNGALREYLAEPMRRAWADLCNVNGTLRFTHSHYCKQWMLTHPVLPVDFLMADEVQDLDAAMVRLMADQMAAGTQVVAVGDENQTIYRWRGTISAFDHIEWPARSTLTASFRFGPAIAEVANLILAEIGSPLRLTGAGPSDSRVGPVADPDVVLCRSNSAAISTYLAFMQSGRKAHIVGGVDELMRFARAAIDLSEGRKTTYPDLACFDSWAEVQEFASTDPNGDEIALMVKLLDEYGPQIVIDALEGMPAEHAAEVVVSTAHKSKGRGWRGVRLASDFIDPHRCDREGRIDELRLLYVSATRAMHALDLRMCEPLADLVGGGTRTAFPW